VATTPAARERQRRYRETHREQIRLAERMRYHADIESSRAKAAERARAYRARHPKRAAASTRKWYENNNGAASMKRWKARNPDKARDITQRARAKRAAAPVVETFTRLEIYQRDGGRCHLCGHHVSGTDFEIDHLIPLSRGGTHSRVNVAIAHGSCNRKRGAGYTPAQLRLVG
jgi:5-methylcytosine-specific restriction endonuclease McrA